MRIVGIAPGKHLLKGPHGAVVEIGSGAPQFDQSGGIEAVTGAVVRADGPDVMFFPIGEIRAWMTPGTLGFPGKEDLLTTFSGG